MRFWHSSTLGSVLTAACVRGPVGATWGSVGVVQSTYGDATYCARAVWHHTKSSLCWHSVLHAAIHMLFFSVNFPLLLKKM